MAWQRKENHDVFGQRGHQDGLRRGKTKAHCEQYGRSRSSRMDYSDFITSDGRLGRSGDLRTCSRQSPVCSLHPPAERRSSSALAHNGNADLVRKKMGLHLETCQAGDHQICSFAWADNFWTLSHSKTHLEQMMKELVEEAER